jgi:hypothetical protein
MPSQPNFKTAHWTGIVRPHLYDENELTTLPVRLPKDLADDVALATYEYRCWFDSEEEFIATAISYVLQSLAEKPPPIRRPKRSGSLSPTPMRRVPSVVHCKSAT